MRYIGGGSVSSVLDRTGEVDTNFCAQSSGVVNGPVAKNVITVAVQGDFNIFGQEWSGTVRNGREEK